MRLIIRIGVIFLLALAVANYGLFANNWVIFHISNYQYQLNLNFLLLSILILFIVIYYVLRAYINIKRLPNKIANSRMRDMLISSRKHLNEAGLHYFEGKYRSCYDSALKSIKKESSVDNQFLAYMLAYKSAGIMRDLPKEQDIDEKIKVFKEPKWLLAKYMAIAENLYNHQQYGQCIDNLNTVLNIDHRHVPAHFLLMKVYLLLNNFKKSYEMLDWLLKNDSIQQYKADKYKLRVISGLFRESNSFSEVANAYNKLNKDERHSFQYGKLYFDSLIRLEMYNDATKFLQDSESYESLQYLFCDGLLNLSRKVAKRDIIMKLLDLAEKSQVKYKDNLSLMTALAILSYNADFLSKSKLYFEAVALQAKTTEVFVYLALIAKKSEDSILLERSYNEIINILHHKNK